MENLDKKAITVIQAWAVGTSLETSIGDLHLSWWIEASMEKVEQVFGLQENSSQGEDY